MLLYCVFDGNKVYLMIQYNR